MSSVQSAVSVMYVISAARTRVCWSGMTPFPPRPALRLQDGQTGVCRAFDALTLLYSTGPEIRGYRPTNSKSMDVIRGESRVEAVDYHPRWAARMSSAALPTPSPAVTAAVTCCHPVTATVRATVTPPFSPPLSPLPSPLLFPRCHLLSKSTACVFVLFCLCFFVLSKIVEEIVFRCLNQNIKIVMSPNKAHVLKCRQSGNHCEHITMSIQKDIY